MYKKTTIGTLITMVAFTLTWVFKKDITTKFKAWNRS
jgi:hypothetical protein